MRAVIVFRTDGLGSRLLTFANGLRLAGTLGVPCYWAWNDPHRVGLVESPTRLLDARALPRGVRLCRLEAGLKELQPTRIHYGGRAEVLDRAAIAGADALLCGHVAPQRLDDEAPASVEAGFAAALRSLVPVPPLAERVRAFGTRFGLRAAVGVHVRRGDLVGHPVERERRRLIGLDRYFAVLDAVVPDGALFLCTDDRAVIVAFRARYPGRVLHYPTGSWSRADPAAVADALIEMILLGATRLVVSGPSAFSRFAAARRGVPLAVLEGRQSLEESIAVAAAAAARQAGGRSPGGG